MQFFVSKNTRKMWTNSEGKLHIRKLGDEKMSRAQTLCNQHEQHAMLFLSLDERGDHQMDERGDHRHYGAVIL
jgi:hypothetical protein